MRRRRGHNRAMRLVILALIVVVILFWADKQFSPVIISLAQQELHLAAVQAMQGSAQEELMLHEEYQNYQELMYIEKDSSGRIVLMVPNTYKLNLLISSISIDAEKALYNLSADSISIPLGAVSGSKLFSSLGPDFTVQINPVSAVDIRIVDDFIDAGINQTRHRIWLHMTSTLGLAVPLAKDTMTVETDVLLCEGIIVGPIPDTYLDLSNILN